MGRCSTNCWCLLFLHRDNHLRSAMSYIFIMCLLLIGPSKAADTFTSLVHLRRSIQAEKDIVAHINNYINVELARIEKMKSLVVELRSHQQVVAEGNVERHLSNPVNAFTLTKKMFELLTGTAELIDAAASNTANYKNESEDVRSCLPSKDDMDGAVLALLRLQDTYDLDTKQLSENNLGVNSASDEAPPLSGDDCFLIGKTAFLMEDYYHSVLWFQEALEKYELLDQTYGWVIRKVTSTFDYLNFALYKQGNVERAISVANRWVELSPGAQPATDNLFYYHQELNEAGKVYIPEQLPPLRNIQALQGFAATDEFSIYQQLCRGATLPKVKKPKRSLVCRYRPIHFNYYFSEEEELNLDPPLVYIYRVVSDREIQVIKEQAMPKLDRSGVFATNASTPLGGIKTNSRVSKSAWIDDLDNGTIAELSLRFERITGLHKETAEQLQVLNYGIGGHYEPHCDFARAQNPGVFDSTGNRIATFILYLTDVEKGGATVFPHLRATVWPKKGGAAFWFNLDENGELDERTLHGACPVLVGYKWVCNKWFHEAGNEFSRPCPALPYGPGSP